MSHPVTAASVTALTSSEVESLRNRKPQTLEQERARLRKASKEFESLFIYQMLKAMRKTIQESPFAEGAPFANSLGKDTFMDLFDMHLSQEMAATNDRSIASMLYNDLVRSLECRSEEDGPQMAPIPLNKGNNRLERQEQPAELLPLKSPVPLKIESRPGALPLEPLANVDKKTDRILEQYANIIDEAATKTALDSALISAVIKVESSGDPQAVSPKGAKGLMQLMDTTAADLGVVDAFDPTENILSGSRYLRQQLDRFGDIRLALAAYNAGPGAVERHQGMPPYEETRSYIDKVMNEYAKYLTFR